MRIELATTKVRWKLCPCQTHPMTSAPDCLSPAALQRVPPLPAAGRLQGRLHPPADALQRPAPLLPSRLLPPRRRLHHHHGTLLLLQRLLCVPLHVLRTSVSGNMKLHLSSSQGRNSSDACGCACSSLVCICVFLWRTTLQAQTNKNLDARRNSRCQKDNFQLLNFFCQIRKRPNHRLETHKYQRVVE